MASSPFKIKLTEPQRLWLRAICSKLRGGEQVSARTLKVGLRDKLPRDFDPSEIDYRLLAHEDQITLLGIALLDPTNELVKKADLVINSIHDLLIRIPEIKSIGADVVSQETKLPKEEVAVIFKKLSRVGYFHDSGTTYGYGIDGLLTIGIDKRAFDAYLKYESLKGILNTLVDDEINLVNRTTEERVQNSLDTPADKEHLTHANHLYDKVKNLIQNSQALDENEARIIVESADDAIREFGSTDQEKKVELRKWRAQAELVLPPGTIEELRKRAEGELLKKSYPRNVLLRNILLTIVILAVIVGGVLALRQALSGSSEIKPIPTPSPAREPVVKFVPLDEKEALIRSFTVKGSGDRVKLKFVSKRLDLTFDFSAPLDTKCDSLVQQIVDHFSLREHVQVDVRMFPTGVSGGDWYPEWRLVLRGQEVGEDYLDYLGKNLRNLATADGDRVGIKLKWIVVTPLSSGNGRPTGVKTELPPDVDL